MDDVEQLLRVGGITVSGVAATFLIWRFCIRTLVDTVKQQAERIAEILGERDDLEDMHRQDQVDLIDCQLERGALRATLAQHGVPFDRTSWGHERREAPSGERPAARRPRGGRLRRPEPGP